MKYKAGSKSGPAFFLEIPYIVEGLSITSLLYSAINMKRKKPEIF